jgi:tRNA(Ile)-lysidine synthase
MRRRHRRSAPAVGDVTAPLPVTAAEFAAAMESLGPFEPAPRLAAGVSGGADSMALAVLANHWAKHRGGSLLALVVDHGLRPGSRHEALLTVRRLAALGIAARLLPVEGLVQGPALAERARVARFAELENACKRAGILHLLLAHHAADQAETLLIRSLAGSGPAGLAAMLPLAELTWLRILRPLLAFAPVRLRSTLASGGVGWIEDPSNHDIKALRPRLRQLRQDRDGLGSATAALVEAAAAARLRRAKQAEGVAIELSEQFTLRPEGFAHWSGRPVSAAALAALFQALAGATYPPASQSVARLAAAPRPATSGGVRLVPAGRLGPGLLAVREATSMASPVPALPGAIWDGRFRLRADARVRAGAVLGPLGDDAARLRRASILPSVVLQTLPAVRLGAQILAVPHLDFPDTHAYTCFPLMFSPVRAAVAALFPFGDA